MNFKMLPKDKDKRNQLILVVLSTVAVLAGLGFGLIKSQYGSLKDLAVKKTAADHKLQQMDEAINRAGSQAADVNAIAGKLAEQEDGMASGDLYSWVINTVNTFRLPYKVEIPQYSPITQGDMTLLPDFRYKQAALSVTGTAYYHDLGKFLADFENHFPNIRVLNLELEPASGANPSDKEKLSFKLDIVTLVKPNPS